MSYKRDLLSKDELVENGYSKDEAENILEKGTGRGSARTLERWLAMGYDRECAERLKRSRIPGTLEYFVIYKNVDPIKARHKVREYNQNKAVTLEGYIEKWGEEEGRKRWEKYRRKQAESNTFEYKKEKYGWTRADFEAYNESRAVTLENLQEKYGEEEGKRKYEKYVEKQRYTNTLEYFQEQYGDKKGREKWKRYNKLKSHTLEAYAERFGDFDEAVRQLSAYWDSHGTSSEAANGFFDRVKDRCLKLGLDGIYYDRYSSEYAVGSRFLDFYCSDTGAAIEFYGDFWHANPDLYDENDSLPFPEGDVRAKDIWERDDHRIDEVKNCESVDRVKIVWEQDIGQNVEKVVNECIQFIRGDN